MFRLLQLHELCASLALKSPTETNAAIFGLHGIDSASSESNFKYNAHYSDVGVDVIWELSEVEVRVSRYPRRSK